MQHLILIRGLPGSGKSTFANIIANAMGACHVETDMYFTHDDGSYHFDARKLTAAHAWCRDCTNTMLREGRDVIVANTFSRRWEIDPYYEIAMDIGADKVRVYEMTMNTQFESVHGVPAHVIRNMAQRWER